MLAKLLFLISLTPVVVEASRAHSVAEVRGAYLRPNSSILRDIYGEAWWDIGIEGNVVFCNYFMGFLGLDIIYNEGKSIGGCEDTDITILPLSLGAKATLACGCIQPYIGIGPKFIWVWIENDTYSLDRRVNFFTVGGVAKVGAYWWFTQCNSLSVFFDYTFAWKKFGCNPCPNIVNHNVNLSNFMVGIGLGAGF